MKPTKDSKKFWDDRFSSGNYVYGTEPNTYFKEQLDKLEAGHLLLPAEGEGRNAIYAARQGWKVDAFDISEKGRQKAQELAKRNHVTINYYLSTYNDFEINPNTYDAIALVYAHLPKSKRRLIHRKLLSGLKPGGHLILEAFSKEQLGNPSGGPKDINMLYDLEELREDFSTLEILEDHSIEVELKEGMHHEGTANVIRIFAQKSSQ